MKLIVGLGNPGQKYARNRHNVGFMAVERIADHASLGSWRSRFHSLACDGELDGERVLLLKPQTYYNETGNAVREAAKFLKVKVGDVIVFHDEIDLAPGKLRVKVGGGLAGNNGLRSMQAQLSSPDFTRVRIGVGHPGDKNQVANYVLRDFPKADQAWLEHMLDAVARSAGRLANSENDRFQSDIAQAMSELREQDAGKSASNAPQSTADPAARTSANTTRTVSQRAGTKSSGGRPASPKSTTKRSSTPSQLELARSASTKHRKTSRKIKKGVQPETGTDTAPESPSKAEKAAEDPDQTNPLAARLKRWFSGTSDKG